MIDKSAVYAMKRPGGTEGIAIDVHLHDGKLRFHDTIRGHEFSGKVTEESPSSFIFQADGLVAGDWQFRLLTIEEFRRRYYKLVMNGEAMAQRLTSTEDLYEWYRTKFQPGY